MNCPKCHEVLTTSAHFCSNCGLSLSTYNTPTERGGSQDKTESLSSPDPLIGSVLDSKYELIVRLGIGGMGAVYRGRRVLIGDEVAVKVLHSHLVADTAAIERFRREARAAAMLRHTNVVTIFDYGEASGDLAPAYIIMELVEGMSLRALLQSEGRLPPERAVALFHFICAGVGAAHRRNIIHRDLKPDNIIVLAPDEDRGHETVKVVDFGIAKLRDLSPTLSLTQTGALMGTPYYMSPEQCHGEALDARADVYSLGAMLYEMLAGQPPFDGMNVISLVSKHLNQVPPPLPVTLGIPSALERAIMRALEKDPAARQENATVFGREVQAALIQTMPATVASGVPPPMPTLESPLADELISEQRTPRVEETTPQRGSSTIDSPDSLSHSGPTFTLMEESGIISSVTKFLKGFSGGSLDAFLESVYDSPLKVIAISMAIVVLIILFALAFAAWKLD